MGEDALRTPLHPHHKLQAGLRKRRAQPDPCSVHKGPSPGAELPAGPGCSACPASVLLHHGARSADAAAPEGHSGSGCAGEAEVEERAACSY